MIQEGRPSNRQQKQVTRQVFLATSANLAVPEYLRGSETEITFSRDDHPPVVLDQDMPHWSWRQGSETTTCRECSWTAAVE